MLLCNACDGHLLELKGPKDPHPPATLALDAAAHENWEEVHFTADRLYPVSARCGDRRVTAFIEASLSTNLFFALTRYGGNPAEADPQGSLCVDIGATEPLSLSQRVELGPVRMFDLHGGGDLSLVAAALHGSSAQPDLSVLVSNDGGTRWKRLTSLRLEAPANMVSVKKARNMVFVAYSLHEDDFSIIKYFFVPWEP